MFDDMYEIKKRLAIFMLTYDLSSRSAVDVFNDFVKMSGSKVSPNDCAVLLDYIDDIKDLTVMDAMTAAMIDGTVPDLRYMLYRKKE